MTIREWLEKHGGADRIHCENKDTLNYDFGNREEPKLSSWDGGNLQITVGDCKQLISFPKNHVGRWQHIIAYDDSAGRTWDCLRRQGVSGPGCLPNGEGRPSPKLCLITAG